MKKLAIMNLMKRVRGGESLMHKVMVKRTSEMQPEFIVGKPGRHPVNNRKRSRNVATRVVPRETIALVSYLETGAFYIGGRRNGSVNSKIN